MMVNRCYICYDLIQNREHYHKHCLKGLFHLETLPELAFSNQKIESLALDLVKHKMGIPGVQRKLSLSLVIPKKSENKPNRLTVVGYLGGEYILKPPTKEYPQMPELEDLTMHLASIVNLPVALHGLVPMKNGLAYITKRFDRKGKKKIAVEDLCQLSLKLTEHKYQSSNEQVAKVIAHYSSIPGEEVLKFFQLILFCFITGNADMHLKNFSLITEDLSAIQLAPNYDLLSTRLLIPEHLDSEELALPLNGKKRNLRKKDFIIFGKNIGIPEKIINHIILDMVDLLPQWENKIKNSFISDKLKQQYQSLILDRIKRIA